MVAVGERLVLTVLDELQRRLVLELSVEAAVLVDVVLILDLGAVGELGEVGLVLLLELGEVLVVVLLGDDALGGAGLPDRGEVVLLVVGGEVVARSFW